MRAIASLRQLELTGLAIDDDCLAAIASLPHLAALYLGDSGIGDAGAAVIGGMDGLENLSLKFCEISDAGAASLSQLQCLKRLDVNFNQIGLEGARAIAGMASLETLDIGANYIGPEGARAVARHPGLIELRVSSNQAREYGAATIDLIRAVLDEWVDPCTADRRVTLELPFADPIAQNWPDEQPVPPELLNQTDAQAMIAAWRRFLRQEIGEAPLPEPEAAGAPVPYGAQIGIAPDGRLTLVDPPLAVQTRDDASGRELHGDLLQALDRLIAEVGSSNQLAHWREAAEEAKERLGGGPAEVRGSSILRIERLRSLREADERRRVEPNPLVEPAEAGVAAALRDAVGAANLYVESDSYLAEQQRRLADPGLDIAISTEEAEAAEADLRRLEIADPVLLAELRVGRETAAMGERAAERAKAWLAGTWRNVVREMLRAVLGWVWRQVRAAGASAGEVATIEKGRRAVEAGLRAAGESAGRTWRAGEPVLGKAGAGVLLLWLADHSGLLTRLWSPEFVAKIQRLLTGIAG